MKATVMGSPKTVPVTACAECPFLYAEEAEVDGPDAAWYCTAVEKDPMPIVEHRQPKPGVWAQPPTWCPLRSSDRLVTLRLEEK